MSTFPRLVYSCNTIPKLPPRFDLVLVHRGWVSASAAPRSGLTTTAPDACALHLGVSKRGSVLHRWGGTGSRVGTGSPAGTLPVGPLQRSSARFHAEEACGADGNTVAGRADARAAAPERPAHARALCPITFPAPRATGEIKLRHVPLWLCYSASLGASPLCQASTEVIGNFSSGMFPAGISAGLPVNRGD